MKKYTTKPIDFTGCHPVIAEHLKRGEAIECWVSDSFVKPCGGNSPRKFVVRYSAGQKFPYYINGDVYKFAEPIALKTKRIMPPERAIPVLIAEGWRFDSRGALSGEMYCIIPKMFEKMGKPLEDNSWQWPPCIIEEVEDDE